MELVTLTIDGKEVQVPKGTNLIEAAKIAGTSVPHYCYHRHLSIAGNCRMCQVQVEGQPKLTIACNTQAAEGMKVHTHKSSAEVADAQRAVLEFILINHPLDCTVCDQAGQCKLQDYYYKYNAEGSRFIEEKEHKVKALPLGPNIILDGERCILCTRCVRFCEEVTKTGELGVFNRGDKSVIGVFPGKPLDNSLSGTVADLCPVGALTHRRWRFNTRIWYTSQQNSICPGCSTGCNIKAAERDNQIVQVKGRLNSDVNKSWLCDEGRYGFDRFQSAERVTTPLLRAGDDYQLAQWDAALQEAAKLKASGDARDGAVFLSPFLTTEELWSAVCFARDVMGISIEAGEAAIQIKGRELSEVERVLISPDYAPNAAAGSFLGFCKADAGFRDELSARYFALLERVRSGAVKRLLFVGDFSVLAEDLDERFISAVQGAEISVLAASFLGRSSNASCSCSENGAGCGGKLKPSGLPPVQVVLPAVTVNEKSGIFVNRDFRIQRLKALLTPPAGAESEAFLLNRIALKVGQPIFPAGGVSDARGLFREMVRRLPAFSGLTLKAIGDGGVKLSGVEGKS